MDYIAWNLPRLIDANEKRVCCCDNKKQQQQQQQQQRVVFVYL